MTNLSYRKSFLPGTKFLIILATTGVIALGVVAWNTRAGTQLGVTLNFPNAKSGDLNFGLVGHWTFDGKDMPSGLVQDLSGNGNHGSQRNMATSTAYAEGRVGQALNFDGTNDYVDAGSGTSLDNIFSSGTTTISVWVRPITCGESTNGDIVDKGEWEFNICNTSTRQLEFLVNATTLGQFETTNVVINFNRWQHVVVMYNGTSPTTNSPVFYVDGAQVATSVIQFPNTLDDDSSTGTLTIGSDGGARSFRGAIDDVRIYRREISADEIKQLYQLGATTKVATTPSQPNSGTGLNAGLVGHWTFDGKDMPSGQVNDVSGQGNNGSQRNMATSTAYVGGRIGQGLLFDGTNDFISIPDNSTLDPTGDLTISAWVKLNRLASSVGANQNILLKGHSVDPFQSYVLAQFSSNDRLGVCWSGTSVSYVCVDTGSVASVGRWYHLTGVKSGTRVSIYLDGTYANDVGGATGAYLDTNSALAIGASPFSNQYLRGSIDDVRIYNRALSSDEIKQLYQLGATTKVATTPSQPNSGTGLNFGLQAHWTFDGKDMPSGQVNDVSGNARNGSQVNTATSTFFTRGQIGQALNFDGVDDRIEFGASTDLARNVSAVTTAAWIKNTGAGTGAGSMIVFISVGSGTGNIRNALTVAEDTDTISCNGRAPDADAASSVTATYTFERNVWYHVSCGIDYANDTGQIYVNGVFQTPTATPTYTNTATNDSSPSTVRVGLSGNASNAFQGLIDDVRIYHRLLTSDEHKQLYQLGR